MRFRGRTILWLVPILVGCTVILLTFVDHSLFHNRFFFPVLIVFGFISPIGGLWGIYQCIRYEKSLWPYLAIVVFIPLGFTWYFFEDIASRKVTPMFAVGTTMTDRGPGANPWRLAGIDPKMNGHVPIRDLHVRSRDSSGVEGR
jgi:hypothetical protein